MKALPVKQLPYAHHAEEITRQNFHHHLDIAAHVVPQVQIGDEEVIARITAVDEQLNPDRPRRLKFWSKVIDLQGWPSQFPMAVLRPNENRHMSTRQR